MNTKSIPVAMLAIAAGLSNPNHASADNPLSITVTADRVTILNGRHPLLTYRYGNVTYKPYIEQWQTPMGINILRDAPHDHQHHHGIMFALMVDGTDFWAEMNAKHNPPGFQMHRGLTGIEVNSQNGINRAGFSEKFDWTTANEQKTILHERRRITVHQQSEQAVPLVTWECELSVPAGKKSAKITGRSYFGLGMRFIESMDKKGQLFNADGKTGKDGTNGQKSKWCAYTTGANGKEVTVAMFDHPDNLRHPARWFTMLDPFSYLSATLDAHHEAIDLKQGETLELRYGLSLWDGKVEPEKIEKLYRYWLKLTACTTQPGS